MKICQLSNGIRVVMEELPHLRSFSMGIWVGAGCIAETSANNGISHFIEHMVFKGTKNRSAKEIASCIDTLGGQLNAFTAKECTCFYVNILSRHYGIAVDLLCDLLLNATMTDKDMALEKGVVCEEIAMVEDTPDDLAQDKLATAFYGDHPLGHTILGPAETVMGLTGEDIASYRNAVYSASNTVISLAGQFDPEALLQMLEEKLGRAAMGTGTPKQKYPLQKPAGGKIFTEKDIEQVNLCLGYPGASLSAGADYYAQSMLANVLGGGMSSRLFQRVREQNGMTYAIYTYLSPAVDSGMFSFYAGMKPEQALTVLELMKDEIQKLMRSGLTPQELCEAKEQLKGSFVLGLESAGSRMRRNGRMLLLSGSVHSVDEVLRDIDNVTMDHIHANIQRIFGDTVSTAVVGKCGDALVKALQDMGRN